MFSSKTMETASKKKEKASYSRQSSTGSTSSNTQAPPTSSNVSAHSQALFLQKVRESNEAVNCGDFRRAIKAYTEAITLDPTNHVLYTNRSTAFAKIQQFQKSLLDARKARELNPKWAKAYIREGTALQQLGQHADALAAFALGLANDTNNTHLLNGLTESALKCPLQEKLEPIFSQLQKLKLDKSPFVIISVIGQELLQAGHYNASIQMLESALKIGSCSLKLRGSVFSALSSAYWGMGNIDKAISYMQKDLQVAKQLGDQDGECRAYGNLGSAFFSKGHYKEALSHNRFQLVLAMRLKDRQTATIALTSLGHVYTAIGDYPNALQSHKQCSLLLKQSNEKLAEAREIGNVGAVYLAMGNFESAVECHLEHLKIAKSLKNNVEEARAFSNLGSAYHYKRNYEKAIVYHKQVLKIGEQRGDKSLEARAYAGLGHASRCLQDYGVAKTYHEKQLDNALQTHDKVAEGRACSNLGIIYHQLAEFEAALKLHKVHLEIAKDLGDRASQGRSFGNIGNAYSALSEFEQAIKFHKQELSISTEVNDRHSEGSTHGNLAVAYQALKMFDSAHQHYVAHLNISRELKDSSSEARAVGNLGNFHSSRGEYTNSIPYYEQYLMLSQDLHDSEGEAKACFCLGYAHFALGNHLESVRYYEQDLSIAKELKDQLGIARAYCNLGLAHKSLSNFKEALDCQKKCLNLMTVLKNVKGRFRSLGNIGDILLKTGETTKAVEYYNQQLQLAKQCNSRDLLASANGSLGSAHRTLGQHDKALGYHTQELSVRQDMNDMKGECRAHGNLGNVYMALGKYMNAFKCYEEQLEKSRELQNSGLEANACGNLAITKMNMGNFEEAIGLFEQQLAMLEQVHGNTATFDKGRAFGNLGDCYEALGDYEESIKCHEQYLIIAQNASSLSDQDKAYRGLGNAHRSVGNLQQALVCFEKRLVVAHELNSSAAKASAYGELGCLHSLLGNFEQAISCLQHQMSIAREMEDRLCEGEAACGLGGVYQQMGEYDKALEYHEMDLKIAETTQNTACQCRAYGNLGLSHESLGEYTKAIRYQEQHLTIAAQMNDRVAKALAYSSLGRVHHALNNHPQAVEYLRQGLQIAEQLGRMEDEAKIRHRLGLALWGKGDFDECQQQLYKASELFESIRRDAQLNSEYKLSLFDLQTACYQALQRVLVTLDRHNEALVVAERACTRAFIDLLMERQAGSEGFFGNHVTDPPPITTDQITSMVSKQNSLVLCFSVAAGFLYSWLLTPRDGVVKFHETSMADVENETDSCDTVSLKSTVSFSSCSLLDNYVGHIRESMGVESHAPSGLRFASRSISLDAGADSDSEDTWEQHMEEIGDKLNAENDRTGFLRIVNRNHLFNSSNYSLSSLFSVSASLNGCSASFPGAGVSRKNSMKTKLGNKSAVSALYHLLIEPFEEEIEIASEEMGPGTPNLILVLQGDLFLIPFSVLRKDQTMEYLFERFNLVVVPSLTSLQSVNKHDKHGRPVIDSSGAVVVGNPKLTPAICQHWHLHDIPTAEYEARIVGEILTARPLIGQEATKGMILSQIEQVEVIHFAAHISWKLSSVILSPGEVPPHPARFQTIDSDDSSSDISSFDGPSLSEYLLTAADILNLKLRTKLVVLSAGYTDDRAGRINSDGVVGLTRSLLSAGAQCVLYCLWPVPDQASKLLMKTMYVCLQEGKPVSQALSFAIKTVQSTKQFSHPSNWGGWVLMGHDIKLSSKVALMGHAICELLQHPVQCKESMRVLLHLIEKSLQRIHQGMKNSMYTTAQSIENKVGGLSGWKDLLQAVGFRFEPSTNGLPPAVFFPQSDPAERLTQASASLQAILGLPHGSFVALAKFLASYEAGEAMIRVMRDILSKMAAKETNVDVKVGVKVWRVTGCHEFLAALGMDLVEVGNDEITLRLGKQANKRHLQFALQSLVSVFNTQEAPRSLVIDSSSSLESLSSSHSGSTSTSNFSKGSSPPLSPRNKKKSFFDPAEMEKMRMTNRMNRMSQGGLSGRKVHHGKTVKNTVNDPAVCLSYQNQIKNMYPPGNSGYLDGTEVYVTALSDSDTPMSATASPDPGSSSASDRLHSLAEVEHLDLNNEQLDLSAESDSLNRSHDNVNDIALRMAKTQSSFGHSEYNTGNVNKQADQVSRTSGEENNKLIGGNAAERLHEHKENTNCDNNDIHKESEIMFERNGLNRNSDTSDASSISQGKFDRDSGIRHSDMSDLSMDGDGRLTPKNQRDLEMFLQQIDETSVHHMSGESGIVSESASSNHSEGSQQSDQSDFRFDPSEIARKVMSEVSAHKNALDNMQKRSMVHSQLESNNLRNEFKNQTPQVIMSKMPHEHSAHLPDSKLSASATEMKSETSVQSKISVTSPSNSAFTSPTHKPRVPPPVPAKPSYTFQSNPAAFRNLSVNVSNLALSSVSESSESLAENTDCDKTRPPLNVQESTKCDIATTTAITVNKKEFSSPTSVNTTLSFSSFRPSSKSNLTDGENQGPGSCYRPDSTTSTSSYCSTPSSMQSVIYKPILKDNESANVTNYDSSSEQTSGSGSASTVTPTINLSDSQNSGVQKRDASPALSTGSSASSKSGKPKKKVSFSDSEPSDTPSPLNLSSNQISYFDINKGTSHYTPNLPTWSYGVDNVPKGPGSHLSGLKQVLGLKDSHQKARSKGPSPPVKYSQENVPKSPRDYLPKAVNPVTSTDIKITDNNSRESASISTLSSPRDSISSINSASVSSLSSPVSPGSLSSLNSPLLPGSNRGPMGSVLQQNQRPQQYNQPPPYGQRPPSYRQAIQKMNSSVNPPNNLPLTSPNYPPSPSKSSEITSERPNVSAISNSVGFNPTEFGIAKTFPQESKTASPKSFPSPPPGFGGTSANVSRAPLRTFPEPGQSNHGNNRHFQGQLNRPQGDHLQSHSSQIQPNRPHGDILQGQGHYLQDQLNKSHGHNPQGQANRPQSIQGLSSQGQFNVSQGQVQGQTAVRPNQTPNESYGSQSYRGQGFPQQQYGSQISIPQSSPSRKVPPFGNQMDYSPSREPSASQSLNSKYTVYPALNGSKEQLEMKNLQRAPNYNPLNHPTSPQQRSPNYNSPNYPTGPQRRPPVPPARIDSWENMDRKLNPPLSPDQPLSMSYPLLSNQQISPKHNFHFNPAFSQANQIVPQSPSSRPDMGQNWGRDPLSHDITQDPTLRAPPGDGRGNLQNYSVTHTQAKIPNGVANVHQYPNGNIPNSQNIPRDSLANVLNNTQLPNGGQLRRVTLGNEKKSFTRTNVLHSSKC